MEAGIETFRPGSRAQWRAWLAEYHDKKQSVWLLYYKKQAKQPTVSYSDAVDEALCFGWIDSKAKPVDALSYMQFFSRRKEKSVWSRVNKAKIERLTQAGLMAPAGFEAVAVAKSNGSWTLLDEAEALLVPADLEAALHSTPGAMDYFLGLSRTDKRNILQWLVLARRPETRQRRIDETASCAGQKLKPKPFR